VKNILDLPQTTIDSEKVIHQKKFFEKLYSDFYLTFKKNSHNVPRGKKLELGSGAGFIKQVIPDVITSDIIKLPMCDRVVSAEKLPFKNTSLSAIYLLNTFHHIKNPIRALNEFERTLKKGGKVIMIEPYNSLWGSFIYKYFHYEGFDATVKQWKINGQGPLSDANNAMPWIVFERDQIKFKKRFPRLVIEVLEPHTPIRYLLSGGLKKPQLIPTFLFSSITLLENFFRFFNKQIGMFVTIVLTKQ
jgi:SAM-dependent methyltransferase